MSQNTEDIFIKLISLLIFTTGAIDAAWKTHGAFTRRTANGENDYIRCYFQVSVNLHGESA